MTFTRRRLLISSSAVALSAPWVRARAADAWLIGQSAPQTGVLAPSNAETTAAARLYFERLNARGGVHGKPIELVSIDDGQDAKRTAENTQKLLNQGVLGLALYRTTPSSEAALPLARKAGTAYIGTQVGPSMLYDPKLNEVFNTRARYSDEVNRAVNFFKNLGLTRVAALVATDSFGKDVLAGLRQALAGAQLDLLAQASIDNRSADVTEQIEQLRKANPQVVLLVSNAKAAAGFIKGARAAGFQPTFVALSNTSSASFVQDLGKAAEGVVVTQVMPSPYAGRVRVVTEFREAVAKTPAVPVSHAGLQGYVTAKFIHEAIRRAGPGVDRAGLVDSINRSASFDLGDFTLNYPRDSRQGSRLAELTVIGRDGRFMY
jgi:ABC-type branched-subunit amino acid transport system substrate-binding protein